MTEKELHDVFTLDGKLYDIPEHLLDKFIADDYRRKDLWAFTISNPTGSSSSYSHVFKKVEGRSLEKDQRTIYYDSEFFFCLALDNALVACVGFTDRYHTDIRTSSIVVQQLQGKRYRPEELSKLRWEKLLLSMVCDWAFGPGMKYSEVNVWCKCRRVDDTATGAMKMIYRVTPARLGFKPISSGCMMIDKKMWESWCSRNMYRG